MTTAILMLDMQDAGPKRRVLGCIQVTRENQKRNLPLNAVQISAKVAERLAHVTVKETFKNPYSEHLEAVYIFPLSGGCAVSSFEMKVGDRDIVGKVAERQVARQQYDQAMQEGKRAALLEQERDDVFTVQVGNLPPGEEVTVTMTYSEKLSYFDNGTTEIRLPLVVAPRYIPGQPLNGTSVGDGTELDTDLVPDASRITPPRLAAGVDPKIALNLTVELAADQIVEDLSCSQHATRIGTGKDGIKVSLSREDELLDRDFVLRWRLATGQLQSNLIVYRNPNVKDECFGMVSLVPPNLTDVTIPARDVIFVLDRSGSMGGIKMVSAARACSLLLATLGPKDRFAIQAFDDSVDWMNAGNNDRFAFADETGKEMGDKYLRTITARGGTEMHGALQQAILIMKNRPDRSRRMPVIVVLTDGEVGHEGVILKQVQSGLDDSRVFTVGIDTAVNDGFLRRLASVGGGTATFVAPGTQLEDALSGVGREIGAPIITDLKIEDINCGLDKNSIAPSRLSDVFEGRPSTAFFKFSASKLKELTTAKVRIKGRRLDGSRFSEEISAKVVEVPALAQLWAKSYIFDLEDQYRIADAHKQNQLHQEIVDVSINHSILTKFTAFIVVDHAEIVNAGGDVRKVVQPVQMPAKWDMDSCSLPKFGSLAGSWGAAPGGVAYGSAPQSQQPPQAGRLRALNAHVNPFLDSDVDTGSASWGGFSGAPAFGGSGGNRMDSTVSEDSDSNSVDRLQSMPPTGPQQGGYGSPPAAPRPSASPSPSTNQSANSNGAAQPGSSGAPETLAESIKRKISNMAGKDAAAQAPNAANLPARGVGKNKENDQAVLESYKHFEEALKSAFEAIRSGTKPDSNLLDDARLRLLKALAGSELAVKMPLLQKYLRAEVIRLIASIDANNGVTAGLKRLVDEQEELFQKVSNESAVLEASNHPFWRVGI